MIHLAPFQADDLEPLFTWMQDRDYRLDSGGFNFVSREQHLRWFSAAQQGGDRLVLSVRRDADGGLVGLVQLVNINRIYSNAELRIRLDPTQLGKGYGTAATRLLCEHAFRDLNLHRVYLHVLASNARAVRCYEKVGFQVEGRLREHSFVDGKYQDFMVLGLLAGELVTPS